MSKSVFRVSISAMVVLMVVAGFETFASHAQVAPAKVSAPNTAEAYKTVENIQDTSSQTRELTDKQLATLDTYVGDQDIRVRLQVMVALRHASPKQAQAAMVIARKGFSSRDSMTRTYALTTLDHLNAPDIVPLAKSMLLDHSSFVTTEAHRILKVHGADV